MYMSNWILCAADNFRKGFGYVEIVQSLEARAGIEPTYKDLQSSA